MRRAAALGAFLCLCTASAAHPEPVAIDHKAVGCIVVGKYPKMNACFSPASSLAQSRVYFRPEGTPTWYYVAMKSDQPCFAGVLPRPGKQLVGKKIEYYVEAQNRTFEPARTAEFAPIVVRSAQECKKEVPVAPFLNNATVAVFPGVPAGFVGGGLGTAAVVGIAAAGAAAAGTAAVVATNNNNDTTTTVVSSVNTTTTLAPTTTTTPPTTTTTLPGKTNHPPFAVLTTKPDPPKGEGPLTVTFDMCKSTDPDGDPLQFFFDFGDGASSSGSCVDSHTYQSSFRAASDVRRQDKSYTFEGCVVDPSTASDCRTRTVTATAPPPPPAPVTLVVVKTGDVKNGTVMDDKGKINCGAGCSSASATYPTGTDVTLTASGRFNWTWAGNPPVSCAASAPCSFTMNQDRGIVVFINAGFRDEASSGALLWRSDVRMPGAEIQVTANATAPLLVHEGQAEGTLATRPGQNRIEAAVVGAAGKAGTWRFGLGAGSVAPGSIRVLQGEVALVTDNEVVFRLHGTAGETIAFTFLTQ